MFDLFVKIESEIFQAVKPFITEHETKRSAFYCELKRYMTILALFLAQRKAYKSTRKTFSDNTVDSGVFSKHKFASHYLLSGW